MKEYVNLFYSILDKIYSWETLETPEKTNMFTDFMNIKGDNDFFVNYFDKYRVFLLNNSLKIFTKDILKFKF